MNGNLLICVIGFMLVFHSTNANAGEHLAKTDSDSVSQSFKESLVYDPNGYLLFCTCMGRYGNQIDHFLGGMAFAKALNRTLLLPPFTGFKNVPFTKWFKLETLQLYHRAHAAEDFMAQLASTYWPQQKRIGFCWLPENHIPQACNMKEGNPFGNFWNGLNVDFIKDEVYSMSYDDHSQWKSTYLPEIYPVIAMRGAPSAFPVHFRNRNLQQYLEFTEEITKPGDEFIEKTFGKDKFVAIHLRNGDDWKRACVDVGPDPFMASTQCVIPDGKLTHDICYPSKKTILNLVIKVFKKIDAKFIYVATDADPMIILLEKALRKQKVKAVHMDPFSPWVDLHVLTKADYFIGNCVSSFSAFAKRARDLQEKPTYFWGLDKTE